MKFLEIFVANVLNADGKTGRAHIGGQIMRTSVLIVERGWNLMNRRTVKHDKTLNPQDKETTFLQAE